MRDKILDYEARKLLKRIDKRVVETKTGPTRNLLTEVAIVIRAYLKDA